MYIWKIASCSIDVHIPNKKEGRESVKKEQREKKLSKIMCP